MAKPAIFGDEANIAYLVLAPPSELIKLHYPLLQFEGKKSIKSNNKNNI